MLPVKKGDRHENYKHKENQKKTGKAIRCQAL